MNNVMDDKIKLVEAVAEQVEIANVRLIDSQVFRPKDIESLPKELGAGHKSETEIDRENKKIWVEASFFFSAHNSEEDQEDPPIGAHATFLVIYDLPNIHEFKDDAIRAFGHANGVYNAWPFWREYVYSTLARMALPPVTLPVFRFNEGLEDLE